jgi:hopene-associated glycosyltransferase HpnB
MIATALACLCLIAWCYLAAFHGLFWKPLLDEKPQDPASWPSVTIIVPARNEAEALPQSLPTLLAQDYAGEWKIILIDDHSNDGTAEIAQKSAAKMSVADKLQILQAPPLAEGWTGKVAAMQTGVTQSQSDYVLFTDADIAHSKDSLRRLVANAVANRLDLASLMVKLSAQSTAEKLLIPAFVFFFAMLYPFRKIADPFSRTAGAAGGVMLVKRKALENSGGLPRIRAALIDDCSLARMIKDSGGDNGGIGHVSLTLTNNVKSLRPYPHFRDIHNMIARTAFTQLRNSAFLLLGSVLGLCFLFFVPILFPLFTEWQAGLPALAAWVLMSALYLPMTRFYGLRSVWALTLPFAAFLYIIATIDSARRTWQGSGGQWKGRAQAK